MIKYTHYCGLPRVLRVNGKHALQRRCAVVEGEAFLPDDVKGRGIHMTVRNLLFDLDDTLLDFHAAERAAIQKTLRFFGVTPTEALCARYSELNLAQWKLLEQGKLTRAEVKRRRFALLFESEGLTVDPDEAARFYENRLAVGHVFMPGAEKLLDALYGTYRLYIVTNGTARVQKGRMASAHLERYFDGVFISEELGSDKPSAAFFEKCFARIPAFDKKETVIVGDSLSSDIRGGRDAGIRTVWFNPSHAPQPSEGRADYEIHALDELPGLLARSDT